MRQIVRVISLPKENTYVIRQVALEWPAYGYRRMTAELRRRGQRVNRKRVLRLMREDNLLCLRKRRFVLHEDAQVRTGLPARIRDDGGSARFDQPFPRSGL